MERCSPIIFLTLLLSIAFTVHFPYIFTEKMGSDEALYAWGAQRIARAPSLIFSREILEYHPPLFPILLALGKKFLFFPDDVSYRLVSLSFSLLGIVSIYWLGVRLANRFVGCFSALVLAFNYHYIISGLEIMSDVPIFICSALLIILLSRVTSKSNRGEHLSVGFAAAMIFLLKISGMIIIPFLGTYYLYVYKKEILKIKLKAMAFALGPIGILTLLYFVYRALCLDELMPNTELLISGGVRPASFWYYFFNIHNVLIYLPLVPLLFYGMYSLIVTKHRFCFLILSNILILFISLSIPPLKYVRYTLILLPMLIVLAAMGLDELIKRLFSYDRQRKALRIVSLAAGCVVVMILYPRTDSLLKKSLSTSTGLAEAGEWLKENNSRMTLIISQNLRPIRYYSGINFKQFDGQLVLLPGKKADFEKMTGGYEGRILLQVDLWSESNPSDFSPFWNAQRDDEYFRQHGFRLIKNIKREVYSGGKFQGKTLVPVVRIYEKPGAPF